MDCSYFGERIDRYIDGELGYMEVAELQSHLSFCPHCAGMLAQSGRMRGVLAAWGRVELATPPGFAERVRAAVELEPAPGSPRPLGELLGDWVEDLDRALGRIPLPGGRTIPVMNVIGWGLAAAAAVALELERRRVRRTRELRPL
jgi:anti-sigma factor RsiW